ncbi:MAG: glycosyltransferase, partial [Eubacterium sp.]|nr:glycosyltransferase [Eubacterium sp.]
MPKGHGSLAVIFAVILLLTELIGAFEMIIQMNTERKRKEPEPAGDTDAETGISHAGMPDVDVFVTTCGEPVELLKATLEGCVGMNYDKEKLHVYLLDDMARDEMKALAEKLGTGYLTREDRKDAKAGNLNAALARTSSPLVAVFDADMIPKKEFLEITVPYLTEIDEHASDPERVVAPDAGFIQTPQHFRNADLFQSSLRDWETVPNEQDYFYHSIEPARNRGNAVILAGSNMLISRKALESTGGFITGTLTEDFATGIEIERNGFTGMAISRPLADGLAPETLPALIRQRERWARGCIQAGKKARLFFGRGLSLYQRLQYIISVHYWLFPLKRFIYIAAPVIFALFRIPVMECNIKDIAAFWLPMYAASALGIRLCSGNGRSVYWSWFYEISLAPFLIVPVILELFGIKKRDFLVTGKT